MYLNIQKGSPEKIQDLEISIIETMLRSRSIIAFAS
jgi:hypothetical protein